MEFFRKLLKNWSVEGKVRSGSLLGRARTLLKPRQNFAGEMRAAHDVRAGLGDVRSTYSCGQNTIEGALDRVGCLGQAEPLAQQQADAQDRPGRISRVLTDQLRRRAMDRFDKRRTVTGAPRRHHADGTDQCGGFVAEDVAEKIGSEQHVKL